MLAGDGVLGLKETSTPTADANYGKLYTKNDNIIYFQDGAGVEHSLAYNSGETYTTSNVSTDRAIDADSTTVDEIADVLSTLIEDLKTAGILS